MHTLIVEACFPEGPVWLGGRLFFAEFGADRVSVWDGTAARPFWQSPGSGPAAIVPFAGGFAVTAYGAGRLVLLSPEGGVTASHDRDEAGAPLVGPNDAVADAHGGLYFTTSGPWESGPIVGTVRYLGPDGRLRLAADDLHYANGIALVDEGRRLLVAESEAGRLVSFAVGPGGRLTDRRLHVRLTTLGEPPEAYPDGLKLGPDGLLYVGLFSAGRILVLEADGRLRRRIEVPSRAAPNLAFSPDGGTLYVAAVDEPATPPYRGRMLAIPNP